MIRICFILFLISSFVACNHESHVPQSTEDKQAEVSKDEAADQNGKIEAYTENYASGQVKVAGQKLNGEKTGNWTSYYPDGKIWSEAKYYKGQKNGKFRDYYKNGILRYKGAYVEDLKQGPWYFYDTDGKVDQRVSYHKGEVNEGK